ncbi:Gfo/Idh/MocA family oxidoreductase [Aquihabitans sp. G128]|uniref:Gfo/Idh/MocA family protein n=1 Tax=Aquihabitans sp. G128 TaxID=2849779 RepID=UPI001C211222|nr:Gfo/Idh/MocA family oxidoreductase [Aquihabitans sp. G128]QXC62114.1 Gfo/Idh/MocA family oxidoreductase [Aquihabitans sp. G128]
MGFLGAGLIANFHALGLFESGEDVAFAGVHDPDHARAEEFAAGWGATAEPSEAAVFDGCDAVYVCTWTSEHERLVAEACRRGLPVFCEKPLAFDGDRAEAMAAAVEAAGVINQVGLVLRSSPAFGYLRHLVADPAAGRVMSVVFRDDQYIPVQGMYASVWRGDKERAGAGTLLEHSIHDVDILEHAIGPVASVSARSANFHGLDGIEDSVATVFDLEGGGVGVHTTIWHDVMERPSLRRVEVFCERRHLVLEGDWDGPLSWTTTGEEAGEQVLAGDALREACRAAGVTTVNPDAAFVQAVAAGRAATPSFRDAVRPHRLVDAIYRSAAGGGSPVRP